MSRSPDSAKRQFSEAPPIWESLKCAIAASSGFQRWQTENLGLLKSEPLSVDVQLQELSLDHQVRRYLRETLETLAY